MKRGIAIFLLIGFFILYSLYSEAQCSLCTKTAQQLGEGPAQGLNSGIIYLMAAPFVFIGVIGYRWWKANKGAQE